MSFQDNIIATGKEKAAQIKSFLEEMQVQMALGKAEARDAIEREQKNFQKFINQQKAEMKKVEEISEVEQVCPTCSTYLPVHDRRPRRAHQRVGRGDEQRRARPFGCAHRLHRGGVARRAVRPGDGGRAREQDRHGRPDR